MSDLPTGTVTFLFTDIEDSTPLWEREADQMRMALARHDAILRAAITEHGGHIYKAIGDAFQAAFALPAQALVAALSAQRGLVSATWPTSTPIRVRMGLHIGAAEAQETDYVTTHTLNRVARIMSAGHGGQILISVEVADLARGALPAEVVLRDMGQHRMKGLRQLEHLFQVIAPDLPSEFPALKSLNAFPNNLPVQLTSFVGREREMAEVKQLLSTVRLLTLIGPGGTGKTRLALRVGADQMPSFADGVWLTELAPLADPAHMLSAIASVFGLREVTGFPLIDQVTDYLREKRLLLILDNCEHLVEACAQLVDHLLRACPHLKIMASSREALGIAGETVYRVPSLALPDPAHLALDALAQCEAVQLFVERVVAVQPHFSLSGRNAPAIAQICRRLDGIPLALELAAARSAVFTPEQIAARLDDRFRLLAGGSRTALPRQQTLRALIDWSYELLSETERALLRRFSVFAGGWAFEAAEAVCPDLDVLTLLMQLVNKSLVMVDDAVDAGEARYRLLETIRQYAREKLLESGEAAIVRSQHLDYFLLYAERASMRLFSPEMLTWLNRFEVEHDNLRAALEWALDNQADKALRLVGALGDFWVTRNYMTEARAWCQAVLTRSAKLPPPEGEAARARTVARVRVFSVMASAAITQGDHRAGRAAAEEGITLARQIGDSRQLARLLGTLALAAAFLGELTLARASAEESETINRQMGDKAALMVALGARANLALLARTDEARAPAYLEEAVALARESGLPWASAISLFNLARIAAQQGDVATARQRFEECAVISREMGDRRLVNSCHSELAHTLRRHGDLDEAFSLYRKTILGWQELGHRAAVARELECFAFIAGAQGKLERAARLFGAAEALREVCGTPMTPMERVEYDQALSNLSAQMNEAAYASAWAGGRAMTTEKVIAYALEAPSA